MQTRSGEHAEGTLKRRPYRAPTVVDYGTVASLTLGSQGTVGDGVAGMNMQQSAAFYPTMLSNDELPPAPTTEA